MCFSNGGLVEWKKDCEKGKKEEKVIVEKRIRFNNQYVIIYIIKVVKKQK
jgi:hypothetical protein